MRARTGNISATMKPNPNEQIVHPMAARLPQQPMSLSDWNMATIAITNIAMNNKPIGIINSHANTADA